MIIMKIRMMLLSFCVLLLKVCYVNWVLGDDSPSTIATLRNDLFSRYDHMEPPTPNHEMTPMQLTLRLDLKYLEVYDYANIVTVHAHFFTSWEDGALKWNPADYGDIKRIQVPTSKIWVPDLVIFNSDSTTEFLRHTSDCELYNTGEVVCFPELVALVFCNLNFTDWPYDVQKCPMYVGSWTAGYSIVRIKNPQQKYTTIMYSENTKWKLNNITAENQNNFMMVYAFEMQRQGQMNAALVTAPACVISALSLLTFWVPYGPQSRLTRLTMCCVSILLYILFLTYVGFAVPSNANTVPTIVAFYRDATGMSFLALIAAILLHVVHRKKEAAPSWMVHVADKLRTVLLTSNDDRLLEEEDDEPDEPLGGDPDSPSVMAPRAEETVPTWRSLVIVLDRLVFVALFVTHVVFLTKLMPSPNK